MNPSKSWCRDCKFIVPIHMTDEGECRRFPPVPMLTRMTRGSFEGDPPQMGSKEREIFILPHVPMSYWCGEFQPKDSN